MQIVIHIGIGSRYVPGLVADDCLRSVLKASRSELVRTAGSAEIAQPGFAARSGFLGSLLYWLTVHQFATLSPLEGKALIISLFIIHGVLVDLFG